MVRELEKKFSGKHVVVVGERKILPKPTRKARNPLKQKRPRSRTLTAVYDAILEDLVFPAEIVGKRIRVKLDGSQLIKVHLDKNQQTTIEHKVSMTPPTDSPKICIISEKVFWMQQCSVMSYEVFCNMLDYLSLGRTPFWKCEMDKQ